ncbi:Pentatricopeptide repeat-containing protein, chloroplastic [Vitis vinifera]|uniref:Pentatricopeptide repeat-containing protein, chloroplastic n=1 Tax=Vitis vinifera TaxID=29760 RepID=A0A438IBG6_VITVI|nr:Pentatricopeptide repeat-containing protein, chloroplastic [Vitis vinifera]
MSSHPLSFTPLRRIPTNTLPLPPPPPSPTSNLHRTPSSRTYIPSHVYKHPSAILLELCTSMKELHQFIPLIIKNGLYSEHLFQTKLVSLFCKFGSLHEAARVFQPIEDKIDELYHTMLKGYARNSSLDDAVSFFCRMRYDGVRPVVYNFTYLLKVCGDNADLRKGKEIHCQLIVNGFASNVFAMTGVVNMYAKCRLVEEAYKMFDRMPERDLVCWNTIISGYAQNGFGKTALELVLRMQEEGKRPDSITVVSILPAVADMGSLRIGRSIHGYSMRAGFESFVNVSTALVDMYSKCGSVGTARLIFDRMTGEMTNVTVMGALHACADLGDVEQGSVEELTLLRRYLKTCSIRPCFLECNDIRVIGVTASKVDPWSCDENCLDKNVFVATALVDMYAKYGYGTHGLGKAALELFEKMKRRSSNQMSMKKDYGLEPAMDHYGAMVDLLGRANRLNEAWDFIQKMPIEPAISVFGAMLGACRIHKNVELGEKAANRIFDLDPDDGGYHVLLANIYATASMWDKVARVRTTMEKKKIQKTLGGVL